MELDETTKNASQIMTEMLKQQGKCHDKAADTEMLQLPSSQAHHEDVTDNALNSQESVITYDGGEKNMVMVDKLLVDKVCPVEEMGKENQPERRRSERLKKEMLLTTMEKNEAMAKKRNLEELDRDQLIEGANTMLRVAKEVLAAQTTRQVNQLLLEDGNSRRADRRLCVIPKASRQSE
ncbi:uncharacterized protein [Miscanthus floridulus]|uniref:uncharacterized protein isoform X2 n=1 Tax=Miscanthus floridulus TaxID=154761 RepID=UPI0034595973